MLKRQFLDYLYSHPKKYKKIFTYKNDKKGYSESFSPNQLLKEIDKETDLGNKILKDLEYQEKILYNFNMFSDENEFIRVFEEAIKNNDIIQESSKNNI